MKQITLDLSNSKKIYLSLYEYIKNEIINKKIMPDEKLPSKRELANNLSISVNTVISTYNLLLDEGYIYSIEKKGFFVSKSIFDYAKNNKEILLGTDENIQTFEYDFTTKNIDISAFPYYTWKKVAKSVLNEQTTFEYKTDYKGDIKLRKEISIHLYQNRGIYISPSQIIIGSGIEYLLSLLVPLVSIKTLCVENPGYKKITKLFNNLGVDVIPIDLDNEGINIKRIMSINANAIYVTPSNQFPTGKKMSLQRKNELINYSIDNNSYIVEDDFDSEFRIYGKPLTSIFSINNQKTIFLSSFSRTISPALRISYMILPNELIKRYEEKYSFYSNTVPTFEQKVLMNFIAEGYYQRQLNKIKTLYKQKRSLIISILERYPDIFDINYKDSYLSILVSIKRKIDYYKLFNSFISKSIDINFLNDFYFDNKEFNNILIIGYCSINIAKIENGIDQIISIIKTHCLN